MARASSPKLPRESPGVDAFNGGAQGAGILNRLSEHLELRAERDHLRALGGIARSEQRERFAFGIG